MEPKRQEGDLIMKSLTYLAIEADMIYRIRLNFGNLTLEMVKSRDGSEG